MKQAAENYEFKKALKIGSVCIFTYMMSYYMRNILSVTTPEMLENGDFTKEFIATMSSVYMIVYASGQLVNGIIGDIIKPRFMVFIGLVLAGVSLIGFPFAAVPIEQVCCFAVLGFGFSMLRGPIVKLVSENTLPTHARMCCVMLSVSCYAGPLIAGLFAMFLKWKPVFIVSGIISLLLAVFSYITFAVLEKSGLIVPMKVKKTDDKKEKISVLSVFKLDNFIVYLLVGMIIEISGTAISFWLPTYMSEYLGFPSNVSGVVYSVISLIKSFGPFLCLVLFKKFGEDDMKMMRVMYVLSTLFFVGMSVITNVWINLLLLLLALLATCCASGVMWSIYIPSLAKSGKVSSANGILDCSGYAAAAAATTGFAYVMQSYGWTGTILLWAGITFVGIILTYFGKKQDVTE